MDKRFDFRLFPKKNASETLHRKNETPDSNGLCLFASYSLHGDVTFTKVFSQMCCKILHAGIGNTAATAIQYISVVFTQQNLQYFSRIFCGECQIMSNNPKKIVAETAHKTLHNS